MLQIFSRIFILLLGLSIHHLKGSMAIPSFACNEGFAIIKAPVTQGPVSAVCKVGYPNTKKFTCNWESCITADITTVQMSKCLYIGSTDKTTSVQSCSEYDYNPSKNNMICYTLGQKSYACPYNPANSPHFVCTDCQPTK
ncbi:uncharacterized protein MELLADRAFT_123801 [Melampsora larici-populina 98AG31]|uniref:Secreted protein n=1 Tax=Melampsora larici-populina (strain 98AG31 / pathotype 3-4-7) TaxID=747676 RepID=F4R4J0_MELLP|nr:uncharacterized protein MELLADRAFT_123801 [Melampsora larici-populina 98AG31]EGG12820.1 secreted protein [Melampsora larici-populina 98AG31]